MNHIVRGSYLYLYYHFVYLSDFNLNITTNKEVYQMALVPKMKSFGLRKDGYSSRKDAEKELAKYEGMSREIEKVCEVVSVRGNRPRIVAL